MPQTLLEWVKRVEVGRGAREGVPTAQAQRVKDLEREVKELRRADEILRLASAFFAQAKVDRQLKSCGSSLTGIATPSGSSRSARYCRSPRLGIGGMPRLGVSRTGAAPGLNATMCWCQRYSACGTPTSRSTVPTSLAAAGTRRHGRGTLHRAAADAPSGTTRGQARQNGAHDNWG